jgi:23S rRNA (uracil1939-C5)-methyltransferase
LGVKILNKWACAVEVLRLVIKTKICRGVSIYMEIDEIITIKIKDLAYGGDGVGKSSDGRAVFIPLTAPGDLVKIKIKKIKKNYAFGELIEILKKGKGRVNPPCPVYDNCGGCQLQHISYAKELESKKNNIEELISRIGQIEEFKVNEVISGVEAFRYRNKAQFPLKVDEENEITAGFYKRRSHEIVPYHDCLIQHPLINRILKAALKELNKFGISVYNEKNHSGLLRHLVIRVGVCTNQALLVFVTNGSYFPEKEIISENIIKQIPELKGIIQNINQKKTNVIFGDKDKVIRGKSYIREYINKTAYNISARSFFQVNTLVAAKLYEQIKIYLGQGKKDTVIDAFSGTGSIALYLADNAEKIYAVESLSSAVKDAEENAILNGIKNIEFIEGLVEKELEDIVNKDDIDTIIFDPPRKGLDNKTIELLKKVKINKIIYISCNPATQARDLRKLKNHYNLLEVQPVDLFPQTYHIESAALLKLK